VTCTSATVPCVSWTITPNAGTGGLGVANLYQFAKNGSLVYIGQYKNTYQIDVTNP
jgi:hypothetical protein